MALKDNWRGFWSSDDPVSSNKDVSGNGRDLFLSGGSNGAPALILTGGKPSAFKRFAGDNDTLNTVNSATGMNFGNAGVDTAFSGCFFIKVNAYTTGGSFVFGKRNIASASTNNEWQVTITATGQIRFRIFGGGNSVIFRDVLSTPVLTIGTWYFIAFDYNGNITTPVLRLFRDTVADTYTNPSAGTYAGMSLGAEPMFVGSVHDGTINTNYLSADLDMIGIREGIWTTDELTRLYNNGNGMNPFGATGAMINFF